MYYHRLLIQALLLLLVSGVFACPIVGQQSADTASINALNTEAYKISRVNPNMSIEKAHRGLRFSLGSGYTKGEADASLALGMAYLAKYNPGDSASYYNHRALELYEDLDNTSGIALASYGLTWVYSFKGQYLESEKHGERALEVFELNEDRRGMVNSLATLVYLARRDNNNEKAIELSDRAIRVAASIPDTSLLADAINTRANIYNEMLLLNQAIDSYFEALQLWEVQQDSAGMAIAYGSIALMYQRQEDYKRALDFNFRKLVISESRGDYWELSKTLNNISQIYGNLNKHDSSLFYLKKGLKVSKEMNIASSLATVYDNIAAAFLNRDETDSAFYYNHMAVSLAEDGSIPDLPVFLVTRGHIMKKMNRPEEALKSADRAYALLKGTNNRELLAQVYALLSDTYFTSGKADQAYEYLIKYHSIRDSISNNDYLRKITRLEIENEYDRKRKEDEYRQREEISLRENKISQQRTFVIGLLILLVLLAVMAFIILRNNILKSRFEKIDLEQRLLRAQMNPHFIFNSLCAVQDFILTNKPKKANAFLVKIATLMRNILENSREEFIALDREIETLKLYLDVQQLRFEEEFEYQFKLEDSIDPENIAVPPMLAQPCLENSIEHGLLPAKSKGRIEVSYALKNDLLMLEVTDNGVGREEARIKKQTGMKKTSISTGLTSRRLENFRKTLKRRDISYEILDLYENERATGTRVIMVMPCKKLFA